VVIALMGFLMIVYSAAEIGFALRFESLVIFSDGLHNLSDGVALAGMCCVCWCAGVLCSFSAVAFWAERKKSRSRPYYDVFINTHIVATRRGH
jgi:Co/Zn/Cd efflux system component